MKNIVIIGGGGFGREVKMLIDQINEVDKKYNFLGYYDDGMEPLSLINGYPVLGSIRDLNTISEEVCVVLAIGTSQLRENILLQINNSVIEFPILIHPNVIIGDDMVFIGEGCIICAGSIITVNINIGKHVIINLACTVGHDTTIEDFCSFMPAVNISGEVNIGRCTYIGTGAKIINQVSIGENTIIGAGAVVAKSLPANCTAVGIPAKPIKFHN